MKHRTLITTFAAVAAFAAGQALADVITLRSGETVEGEVLEVTREEVRIKTVLFNITTTKTYRRSQVTDIDYKPLPDGFFEQGRVDEEAKEESEVPEAEEALDAENAADEREPASRRRGRTPQDPAQRYVVVPVQGAIGEEVTADGLRKALVQARGQGIGNVVFTVDSPGGLVYEAVQILEVLAEFDADIEYICVIEKGAISAATVFAAGADRILVRPDARLGGAVAYSSDNTTGAAAVDAKFNSIWAAEIAARADAKGHPGDVFRAMVVPEAEVWQGADGRLTAARAENATQIDGPTTILTVRASQMVSGGMAAVLEGGHEAIGELLGRAEWAETPVIGTRAMMMAARERAGLQRRFDRAIEDFTPALETFQKNDPRQFRYSIVRYTNGVYDLDAKSKHDWITRSDEAIRACNTMLRSLKELASVNSAAERTGALHLVTPESLGHDVYTKVKQDLDWLSAHRNNPPARDMAFP